MNSTGISLSAEMKSRLTPGHEAYRMEACPPWDAATMEGAMGLRSTSRRSADVFIGVSGLHKTPLSPAWLRCWLSAARLASPRHDVVLGWHTLTPGLCGRFGCKPMDVEIIWNNGMSFGYSSYIGYDPEIARRSRCPFECRRA